MVKVNLTDRQIFLLKKNEHIIGFLPDLSIKTFERLPISDKQYRKIVKLANNLINVANSEQFFDIYFQIAICSLADIKKDEFYNSIWESTEETEILYNIFGLKDIIHSCILRYIYGIAYFSPNLEAWIVDKGSPTILLREEIEAWDLFYYKQMGIMPYQYHYFYEQGDTIIYHEHLQDLTTIDKMWNNKLKKEEFKEESKNQENNPLARTSHSYSSGKKPFAGGKFHYKKR